MSNATDGSGRLLDIADCYIKIAGRTINMNILPDISDSKSASYNDEPVIGRSFPMKTYSHSENRSINWTAYFIVTQETDIEKNLMALRTIESAVYPRVGNFEPYAPPPVCALRCGHLLKPGGQMDDTCAVLRSYSVKFPTDVAWDSRTKLPYKFSVDMTWEVIYESSNLPGQGRIFRVGG